MERFQNPFIRHELMSIALNSISKYQVRVLPSVLTYIEKTGKLPDRLLYSLAALIRFYKGEWEGQPIALNDTPEIMTFFKTVWQKNDPHTVVQKVLSNSDLWKTDLTMIAGLADKVEQHLKSLDSKKIGSTLLN